MPREPFMLVSLNEEKAQKLSRVLSNPTAIRILEHLAGKDATESEISKQLDIPLSTVHYNLQQLVDAKLVVAEEFHYSSRGKEVNHYKLANKYIIIAPQEQDTSFLQHLRKYLPAALIAVGAAAVLKVMQATTGTAGMGGALDDEAAGALMAEEYATRAAPETVMMAMDVAQESANAPAPVPWWQSPMVDYALIGAACAFALIFLIEAVRHWRRKK